MGARSEKVINVGDKEVTILFTNRALIETERLAGKSIFAFARGLIDGQSTLSDVIIALRAGMESARRDNKERPLRVTQEEAMSIVDKVGIASIIAVVAEGIAEVLNYGNDDESEEDESKN